MFANLPKWLQARTALNGTGNAMRPQQPPGNDIAIPRVNNRIHPLIQQIALHDFNLH
jgi:hypothetical protein